MERLHWAPALSIALLLFIRICILLHSPNEIRQSDLLKYTCSRFPISGSFNLLLPTQYASPNFPFQLFLATPAILLQDHIGCIECQVRSGLFVQRAVCCLAVCFLYAVPNLPLLQPLFGSVDAMACGHTQRHMHWLIEVAMNLLSCP